MSTMQQWTTRVARLGALVVGAWVAAAAPARAQEGGPITLSVDNARPVPVVVYLERGAFDRRLGTVPAQRKADLALPIQLMDGDKVQITVHPEGGSDLTTPHPLVVHRGHEMSIYVPTSNEGWVALPPPETIPDPGIEGPTLTVENRSAKPVVAFIEGGVFDTRIGTVPAGVERTFALPDYVAKGQHSVDVFMHVEGGTDLASQNFDVGPMAHLLVKVPA